MLSWEHLVVFLFFSTQHMEKQNKVLNHWKLENKSQIYELSQYTGILKTQMVREELLRSSISCVNSMNKRETVLTLVNQDFDDNIWTTDTLIMQNCCNLKDTGYKVQLMNFNTIWSTWISTWGYTRHVLSGFY